MRMLVAVVVGLAAAGAEAATFVFATAEEGRAILARADDFVAQMSPFDRAARAKSAAPVSEAEYLAFAGRHALAWNPEHKARVEAALAGLKPALDRLAVALPEPVVLVETSGQEEGQAEYTRGDAVLLPKNLFGTADKKLDFVLAHELFHILSRHNAALREDLYEDLGFEPCPRVGLPAALADRKITNPDAPVSGHCIDVQWQGRSYRALPVLFADAPYDAKRGGEFFEYLQFRLVLDTSAHEKSPATSAAGSVRLVSLDQVGGFFEKVGENTTYVIHPEEILADNFAQVLTGVAPATPAVHERLRRRLLRP